MEENEGYLLCLCVFGRKIVVLKEYSKRTEIILVSLPIVIDIQGQPFLQCPRVLGYVFDLRILPYFKCF